ncbi:MAG: exodeoxyribonuclease VII small subunit [Chthoniobacterales bacterium]
MPKQNTEKEQPKDLDAALLRLEALMESMESGDRPLEELIASYEEGVELVKFCEARLGAAEKRIQIIEERLGGELQVGEFHVEE